MNATENENNHITIVENYYDSMMRQDFETMGGHLHPDIIFIAPLAEMSGKEPVVEAAKGLSKVLDKIEIRSKFSAGNQIMLAYDLFFPEPIGKLRASVLMDFQDDLISRIELFYDGRPFDK